MEQIFTCILLLLSLAGTFSKYVYIREEKYWQDAQKYCRQNYTDLAPVSNKQDMIKLQEFNKSNEYVWIGLERISGTKNWMWSGGGKVSEDFWGPSQPNNGDADECGFIFDNVWHDALGKTLRPSFCYRAIVVRKRKTWEEALEYCRKHHNDLASVASKTEMLLIQTELKKNVTTGLVWIGLHFFSGDWLWVDRQALGYEAWGQEGKPSCPPANMECAALQNTGLINNGTNITSSASGSLVNSALSNLLSDTKSDYAATYETGGVWGAHNCEEKLNFVCY